MNKQRKIKHVLVAIVSLFIIEFIAVTYFSKDMSHRYLSNNISTSYKKQENKKYSSPQTKIPKEFTKYFHKYEKKRKTSKYYKSAISLGLSSNGSWTAGYAFANSQIKANKKALASCRNGLVKYNVNSKCVIYAEGLNVVYQKLSLEHKYNKKISKKYKVVNIKRGSYLNVRSGPGTRYRKIAKIKYNAKGIIVLYCVDGWCKIKNRNGNRIGWVSSEYLQKETTRGRH